MTQNFNAIHIPVLLQEVLEYLHPGSRGIYVDCNLGMGGHAEKILEMSEPGGRVIGFDWDAKALAQARQRLAKYGERVCFCHRNFAEIKDALNELRIRTVDGILLDLGLSSLQLEDDTRGFSFKGSQPLDMRMDSRVERTAADLVNTLSQQELADIFYYYGEERQSRPIAANIVKARRKEKIATTDQLVELVSTAVPKRFHPHRIHVATRVFQALRIAVNGELDNLLTVLADGVQFLTPGSRFCVITFHSLEDRIVKRAFRENDALEVLTAKPVTPKAGECEANPRARSAKMRVARKCEVLQ